MSRDEEHFSFKQNPIFMQNAFEHTIEDFKSIFSLDQRDYIYTRGGNPTVNQLEQVLSKLECGVDAVAFSSGMAAISSTIMAVAKVGEEVIVPDVLYGCTHHYLKQLASDFGVKIKFCSYNLGAVLNSLTSFTKAIYLECPNNPFLEIIDLKQLREQASAINPNIKIIVDNTILTPYLQKPLTCGADIVVSSLSKYISGHGDVIGGIAVARCQNFIDELKFKQMCLLGSCMQPLAAYLILRGLKTLPLRMERVSRNLDEIYSFLKQSTLVREVYTLHHALEQGQLKDVGGLLSFSVSRSEESIMSCLNQMTEAKCSVSYGAIEHLISYPLEMTHRSFKGTESGKRLQGLVRLSLGLYGVEELIKQLHTLVESKKCLPL